MILSRPALAVLGAVGIILGCSAARSGMTYRSPIPRSDVSSVGVNSIVREGRPTCDLIFPRLHGGESKPGFIEVACYRLIDDRAKDRWHDAILRGRGFHFLSHILHRQRDHSCKGSMLAGKQRCSAICRAVRSLMTDKRESATLSWLCAVGSSLCSCFPSLSGTIPP